MDYRKRSATRRIHNPQAHLRRLAMLGGGRERVVQRVPLSAAWREFDVEIAAPGAFDQASVRQVQAVIWRGRDPVLPPDGARDGGLRMPATSAPIADIAFSKTDAAPRRLSWAMMPDEPPFYRWQARVRVRTGRRRRLAVRYSGRNRTCRAPPIPSLSGDPRAAPPDNAPMGLRASGLDTKRRGAPRCPRSAGSETCRAAAFCLVDTNGSTVECQAERAAARHDRRDGRPSLRRGASLSRPPQQLLDRELFINTPFIKTVTVTPLVAGAPPDVVQVALIATYEDQASGYRTEQRIALLPPDFRSADIKIPVVSAADVVRWEAIGVRASGEQVPLGRGESAGGFVSLRFSTTRNIRVEWLGPTPADLALRWVRATFRNKLENGQVGETATLEWRGNAVDGQRIVTLPAAGRAEWSVERRFEDGRKDVTVFTAVPGDLVPISG